MSQMPDDPIHPIHSPDPTQPVAEPSASRSTQIIPTPVIPTQMIPDELSAEIRKLAHDLSNALEIIVQTSYLLSLADLKEPASQWLQMLDSGVTKALDINQALRVYLKDHTPR